MSNKNGYRLEKGLYYISIYGIITTYEEEEKNIYGDESLIVQVQVHNA